MRMDIALSARKCDTQHVITQILSRVNGEISHNAFIPFWAKNVRNPYKSARIRIFSIYYSLQDTVFRWVIKYLNRGQRRLLCAFLDGCSHEWPITRISRERNRTVLYLILVSFVHK